MATTLKLVEWIASGVNTTAGVAVASGKARFYAPGTLTPANVYSDSAGAAAITQPLTLSAGGNGTVYTLDPVRCIVKDSLDTTTLWDVTLNIVRDDQIYVTSAAFNGGTETTQEAINDAVVTSFGGSAGYWKYKESSSATERLMKDWMGDVMVSVKDFGALGDDATDDRAAIVAAIARVVARGGGIVYVPPGTYRISSFITVTANVSLAGSSSNSSIIKNTNATGDALVLSGSNVVSRLGITTLTTSTGIGIIGSGALNSVEQVSVSGHRTGIQQSGASAFVRECNITTTTSDASAIGLIVFGNNTLVSCVNIAASTGYGVSVTTSLNTFEFRGVLVSSAARGFSFDGSSTGLRVLISGCYSTAASTADLYIGSTSGGIVEYGNGWTTVTNNSTQFNLLASAVGNTIQIRPMGGDGATVDAAGGATVTPSPAVYRLLRIRATSAGTVTVASPGTTFRQGHELIISFFNNSGGAVTWTLNAIYKVVAAPAPADGSRCTIPFFFDSATSTWIQHSGSAVVVG